MREMSIKTLKEPKLIGKQFPSKIQFVQDKKVEVNGTISYLIQYRNSDSQNWASKDYLCKDEDNRKRIQRFQRLLQAHQPTNTKSTNHSAQFDPSKEPPEYNYEFCCQQESPLQFNLEANFKIIGLKTNKEGVSEFQVKYYNGLSQWIHGDFMRINHASKVLRFYEKRIQWK